METLQTITYGSTTQILSSYASTVREKSPLHFFFCPKEKAFRILYKNPLSEAIP
jgi:hypothetical protein